MILYDLILYVSWLKPRFAMSRVAIMIECTATHLKAVGLFPYEIMAGKSQIAQLKDSKCDSFLITFLNHTKE